MAIVVARRVADSWKLDAANRRRVARQDPVADTLEYCANELVEAMRPIDAPGAVQTAEQFARDHGVTPQAVRKWIQGGRLDAERTGHGYLIRREAVVRPGKRVSTTPRKGVADPAMKRDSMPPR
jgi:excisionase family DNA binding protein